MRDLLRTTGAACPPERRHLLEGYRYRHMARRVGGVGSVGTRTWIVLLTGRDDDDPLFLQVKQAGPSSLERYGGRRRARHHGQRVVQGQRLMQVDGDIFLGWLRVAWADGTPRDYYVRQLWDWKLGADVESMSPARLTVYGTLCGWTLARAHARSGDRVAIAAYLGRGGAFDRAVAAFAERYADQNERDHAALWRLRAPGGSRSSRVSVGELGAAQPRRWSACCRCSSGCRATSGAGWRATWPRGSRSPPWSCRRTSATPASRGSRCRTGSMPRPPARIFYALFCTSRHISTGPSSSLAAVAGSAVVLTGVAGEQAAQLVAAIALATGVLFLALAAPADGLDRELPLQGGGHGVPRRRRRRRRHRGAARS